jgi:hypothetical protein
MAPLERVQVLRVDNVRAVWMTNHVRNELHTRLAAVRRAARCYRGSEYECLDLAWTVTDNGLHPVSHDIDAG